MQKSNPNVRIGVVGTGHLGSIHARLWKTIEGAELVGIYDVDTERASNLASELDVRLFPSLGELLSDVDGVSIVTPTSTHGAVGMKALESGVHSFVEKPITARLDEAERLIDIAERRGLVLQVGHVERFNPAFAALEKHHIDPMFIESHRMALFSPRATDVAVVLDLMIHDIDLVLCLVDSPVAEIRASGVSVVSDTIDIANARLEFANGCVANLTASRISQRPMRKMRLFQQDAYISIDFATPSVELFRISDEGDAPGERTVLLGAIELGTRQRNIIYQQLETPETNAIADELGEFVAAIRGEQSSPVTGRDAAEALRIAQEIIREIERKPLSV